MVVRRLCGVAVIAATFGSLVACSSSDDSTGETSGSTDAGGVDATSPALGAGDGGPSTSVDATADAGLDATTSVDASDGGEVDASDAADAGREGGSVDASVVDSGVDAADAGADASADPLAGVDVSLDGYCCMSPLLTQDLAWSLPAATIGSEPAGAPLFANIANVSTLGPIHPLNANIYVTGSSIKVDYLASGTTASGDFNGYVFTFSPGSITTVFPSVVDASLDSASTLSSNQVKVSVPTPNIVDISLPSVAITTSTTILVDLILASPDGG